MFTKLFASCHGDTSLFGIPRWHEYLEHQPELVGGGSTSVCNVVNLELGDTWLIALAILEILVRLIAFAALAMIIFSGVKLIMSQGNPDRTTLARQTLTYSVIGLIVAVSAATIISFVAGQFIATETRSGLPVVAADSGVFSSILPVVFSAIGALSILYIVIGGFRYTMASGNPEAAKKARSTIIFAIAGLVVAISGFIIVNFILDAI